MYTETLVGVVAFKEPHLWGAMELRIDYLTWSGEERRDPHDTISFIRYEQTARGETKRSGVRVIAVNDGAEIIFRSGVDDQLERIWDEGSSAFLVAVRRREGEIPLYVFLLNTNTSP